MKYSKFLLPIILFYLTACSDANELFIEGDFQFIVDYTTTIYVGGFAGYSERTFNAGETYSGTDTGTRTITIRIAEYTDLNGDCPNSWCYQEFLEVPRNALRLRGR